MQFWHVNAMGYTHTQMHLNAGVYVCFGEMKFELEELPQYVCVCLWGSCLRLLTKAKTNLSCGVKTNKGRLTRQTKEKTN